MSRFADDCEKSHSRRTLSLGINQLAGDMGYDIRDNAKWQSRVALLPTGSSLLKPRFQPSFHLLHLDFGDDFWLSSGRCFSPFSTPPH